VKTLSPRRRRGFSLVEVLIALAITGTLLTASLAALDASFKSYKLTTEGASTNVVTRLVMQRLMAMIRTPGDRARSDATCWSAAGDETYIAGCAEQLFVLT